jgi:TrmH RNA methyltransferase
MRNKLTDELAVCGVNAVLAAGERRPETINRLFLREDRLKTFSGLCKQLAERKQPYKICENEELERICKSVHHQGVVAMIEAPIIPPLDREELEQWAAESMTGLVLHSVGNDHNLGAIARSAAFFDAHFIVLNENDSEARLTTSAYRVAEGGMEYLKIRKISDTAAFLRDASKQIITIGTDIRARRRISDLAHITANHRLTAKRMAHNGAGNPQRAEGEVSGVPVKTGRPGIALALGNEETGLPQNVKDQCSCLLRIPCTGNIESLNVAQAAALFLNAIFEL